MILSPPPSRVLESPDKLIKEFTRLSTPYIYMYTYTQHPLQQHPESRDCRAASLKDALYFFVQEKCPQEEGGQGALARTDSRQTNQIETSGLVDSYLVQTIPVLDHPLLTYCFSLSVSLLSRSTCLPSPNIQTQRRIGIRKYPDRRRCDCQMIYTNTTTTGETTGSTTLQHPAPQCTTL